MTGSAKVLRTEEEFDALVKVADDLIEEEGLLNESILGQMQKSPKGYDETILGTTVGERASPDHFRGGVLS